MTRRVTTHIKFAVEYPGLGSQTHGHGSVEENEEVLGSDIGSATKSKINCDSGSSVDLRSFLSKKRCVVLNRRFRIPRSVVYGITNHRDALKLAAVHPPTWNGTE